MTSHVSLQRDAYPVSLADTGLFDGIRSEIGRPDLSDGDLQRLLCGHEVAFLTASPEARLALVRSLPVPPPRLGLEMPAHDLNPPLAARFAPVATFWQRLLQPVAPQLKRLPVSFKDH